MKFASVNPFLIKRLLAAVCITSTAHAADGLWDSGAATQNWQDAANWNPDGLPGLSTDVFTSTETATFSTTGSGTINLGDRINIRDIRFGVTTGNANAFIIGDANDTLNLSNSTTPGTNGMTLVGTGVTNTQQIGVAGTTIKLSTTASSQYWFNNSSTTSAAKLDIAGNITTAAASGTSVLTLTGTNGGTVSGTLSNGATANLALTKSGTGTWTLTAANGYTGTTTISGGILALSGGNNRLATAGTVNFSAAGTLDVGTTEQTLANLTAANTITGTVTGSTGGKLTLTGSSFALGGGASQTNTLGLSGLPTFVYNNSAGTFRVSGVTNTVTSGGAGVLTLASGTNTITASVFGLGDFNSTQNQSVNSGTVNLGTINTVNANTLTIGGNRGAGVLQYASGTNTPTLTLRGSDGSSRVTSMILSDQGGPNTTGTVQGLVNLTTNVTGTSTLDAMITTLTIGKNTRATSAGGNSIINTGTFTMGGGTLDATTIFLAQNTAGFTNGGSTSKTTGNLTVTDGTIKVGSFYFADQNTTGSTGSALEANFSLNGGGHLYATTIAKGAGTGTHTATRTFNWNDGTIHNYDASTDLTFGTGITVNLAATGTHTFDIGTNRSGTVDSALSGTNGTLVKSGNGTLTLNAANSFTGSTTVQQGTLALGSSGTISTSLVLGTSGGGTGTLDVTAKSSPFSQANVSGNGTLNIGSGKTIHVTTSLAPGFATGTLNVMGSLALIGATTTIELAGNGGSLGLDSDYVNVSGSFTLDGILNIISYGGYNLAQIGTYNLFDATSGFSGDFDSVNVGGLGLTLSNDVWSASSGGFDYSFDETNGTLTVVPEPAAALLGGLGMLCLLRRRRR